jgi:hypothetical protein
MRNPRKFLVAIALAAMPLVSLAANVTHQAYVTRVQVDADGTVRLSFATEAASCTNPNTPKYYIIAVGQQSVTADGLRAMHATALTALTMERRLSIVFDNATTNCYINRLQIIEP